MYNNKKCIPEVGVTKLQGHKNEIAMRLNFTTSYLKLYSLGYKELFGVWKRHNL